MAAFVGLRIHPSAAFVKQALWSGGGSTTAGQSDAFAAMLSEALQFFAARAKGSQNAALVWAVDRLKSLRAEGHRDPTAGCRVAVLEHILEADDYADDTGRRFKCS